MKSLEWVFFTARRYLKERRTSRTLAASFLSTAGIAVGVLTLVVVMGVMNGFQLGFIEDILEIRSYDLRVTGIIDTETLAAAESLKAVPGVKAAVPFLETQTLARGRFGSFEAVEVRGLPVDIEQIDPGMIGQLNLVDGDLDFSAGLVIGRELARAVGVHIGDTMTLAALSGSGYAGLMPASREMPVAGIFQSGFYEYDRGLVFTSLENVQSLASGIDHPVIGIKLKNRYRISSALTTIADVLESEGFDSGGLVSWREFNRAFFGALRMEKLTMSLLIGVMFLVVAGNIYHSLRRGVQEKRAAIAVLRAVGGGSRQVQLVFILEGAIIGFAGTFWGLLLGLLTVTHINSLFRLLEHISSRLAINSGTFYLSEVPVRVLPAELVLIGACAFSAALLSAWMASRDVVSMKPSQILRYE